MSRDHTVVVGGGLAGVAAALHLADAGHQVTLLESRPRLGGSAFSFRRGPLTIDNGQHVFLRCCTAYRGLLDRLGVADQVVVQDQLDIAVLRPDGRHGRLTRTRGVPAPIHLTGALARYGLLSPADRVRAVRGALALRRLKLDDDRLDQQTLGTYLRRHGQNDATIGSLWGVVATATLNLPPDEASLALAAKVFLTGLLDHADAADVGYAAVPLGELHSVAAARALRAADVEVLVRHRVESVESGPRIRAHGPSGVRSWEPDSVVLAVPHGDAYTLAPELAAAAPTRGHDLGSSPIVNVHVRYDRRVTDLPFAAAVGSPVQWFFDRTEASGLHRVEPRGQYLAITVSAATGIIDTPSRELQEQFIRELARLLPKAAEANVVDAFVTRERRATFRQAAGSAPMRLSSDPGVPGVRVAGAWTATGWPDTMEGAVLSGVAAAESVLTAPTLGTRRVASIFSRDGEMS